MLLMMTREPWHASTIRSARSHPPHPHPLPEAARYAGMMALVWDARSKLAWSSLIGLFVMSVCIPVVGAEDLSDRIKNYLSEMRALDPNIADKMACEIEGL